MRCKFDDETLHLLALAIGTSSNEPKEIPDHYLRYLARKLTGEDGLSLDLNNKRIYKKLKKIVDEMEDG